MDALYVIYGHLTNLLSNASRDLFGQNLYS